MSWTGLTSANWGDSGNWSTGAVPNNSGTNTYAVLINEVLNNPVTLSGTITLTDLSVGTANSLNLGASAQLNLINSLSNSGAIGIGSGAAMSLGAAGAVANTGGTIKADGGTLTLDGSTVTGGNLVVSGNGTLHLLGGASVSGANTNVTSGQAVLTQATVSGGSFTVGDRLTLSGTTIDGLLTNNGNIAVTGSGYTRLGGTVVNNAGHSIDVAQGTFLFLDGGGSYTNNGAVTLNATTDSRLVLDGSTGNTVRLNGSGTLHLGYSGGGGLANLIDAYNGAMTLENGAGHTIAGSGRFTNFALRNEGTITASQAPGITLVSPNSITNTSTGVLEAINGSTLSLSGPAAITNDGIIRAHGGTVTMGGSTVTGGSIVVTGNGRLDLLPSTTVTGTDISVTSGQAAFTWTKVSGGSVTVGDRLTLNDSSINGVLTNNGNIAVTGSSNNRVGGTVVNNAGHSIDVAEGGFLFLYGGGSYTNNGALTLNATTDSRLVLDGSTGNTVRLNGSGTLHLGYSGGGGAANLIDAYNGAMTLENGPNHKIVGSGRFTNFALLNEGTITANQAGNMYFAGLNFTNAGTVSVASGRQLQLGTATYFQTAGGTEVNGTLLAPAINIQGGTLSGAGEVIGNVTNSGTVSPGNSPGSFRLTGNYIQTGTGVLDFQLLNTGSYDRLTITGTAVLNGTLRLTLLPGFQLVDGDMFTILSFASYSGGFLVRDLAGGNWIEHWNATNLTLEYDGVPEPSAWLFVAGGMIWIVRRGKRSSAHSPARAHAITPCVPIESGVEARRSSPLTSSM